MQIHKKHPINKIGKDYIVGDLHGCYEALRVDLIEVDFDKTKDRLFSVGDLIDRGPDSMKCLNLLREPWFYAVRGNHEQFMIETLIHKLNSVDWINNGGAWYLEETIETLMEAVTLVENMPYMMTIETSHGDIGVCHAQYNWDEWLPDREYEDWELNEMIWARTQLQHRTEDEISGIFQTFHGHSYAERPLRLGNRNFIDTGACFKGGFLTLLRIQ